jgi:alpha-L-fucosidase
LFEIYLTSVGRGSTLLLNVPPDRRGLFHENDVKALRGFQSLLSQEFQNNLAANSKVEATSFRGDSEIYSPANVTDDDGKTYWATDDGVISAGLDIELTKNQTIKYLMVQEYIPLGQRVKSFNFEVWKNDHWERVAEGTTIGHKRILRIDPVETNKIRFNIADSKACPLISNIAIY